MPAEQIVDKGTALRISSSECALAKNVVVHQTGAVGNFNHKVTVVVVVGVAAVRVFCACRSQARWCQALTVVDAVVVNLHVNGGVELNARNFVAVKFMLEVDVVNIDLP